MKPAPPAPPGRAAPHGEMPAALRLPSPSEAKPAKKSPRVNSHGLIPGIEAPPCEPSTEAEVLGALTERCNVKRHERAVLKRLREARRRHDEAQSALAVRRERAARSAAVVEEARRAGARAEAERETAEARVAAIGEETARLRSRAGEHAAARAKCERQATRARKAYQAVEKSLHQTKREAAGEARSLVREQRHLEAERNALGKERAVLAETRRRVAYTEGESKRALRQLLERLDDSIEHVQREVGELALAPPPPRSPRSPAAAKRVAAAPSPAPGTAAAGEHGESAPPPGVPGASGQPPAAAV